MSAQLELDLTRPTGDSGPRDSGEGPFRLARGRAAALLGAVLHWTAVWVPLVFLVQLLWLGLLPARSERARLDRAEAEVRARAGALEQESRELASQARMLADGIFQERVRRSLVDPHSKPLTLERARAGSGP